MKFFLLISLLLTQISGHAQTTEPETYPYLMTDLASQGIDKNELFSKMETQTFSMSSSICSNRALIWAYDLKRFHQVDAQKIFLFFTEKTGLRGRMTWWYHVAPVVREGEELWVLDPAFFKREQAITIPKWLKSFAGISQCREIRATDTELIKLMRSERVFPEAVPGYGKAYCYYHIAPAGLWTPGSVVDYLLGAPENRGGKGKEIDPGQLFAACIEAVANGLDRYSGRTQALCQDYLKL